MGVRDLWSILTPFCERKPLYELQGKTVAVDLSCWICEAQNIAEYTVQPRMYLRNLYFRTCYLLLMEVNPVFILEGKAPRLKFDTIASRNAIQFKGEKPKKDNVKTGKDRTRFNFTLRQCEEMLRCMGLACIRGNGEAEAMCAYLNEDGMVDGCISQDSDCFAYGAKVVYRNFSISSQGRHAASGGSVDIYDIRKVTKPTDFSRNKIVALALLCGCDYGDGIHGIGKDSALKLFDKVADEEILDRMRNWRKDGSLFKEFERKIADKNVCTSCGHSGKIQGHSKTGCVPCGTSKGCDFSRYKEERLDIKNELNIRSKAIADPTFPNEELIKEFLMRKDNVSGLDLQWKQPDMVGFVKFCEKYLSWEEIYAFEKLLPILTRWQLINFEEIQRNSAKIKGILFPDRIKKIRNLKGVCSYEIIWLDREKYFLGLTSEENIEMATIEPQNLVRKAYPNLVAAFEQSKLKLKKRTKKLKKPIEELSEMLENTSITEPKAKKIKKPKEKVTKTKSIDTYFKKAILNNFEKTAAENVAFSTPKKSLDSSNFGDETDSNLSDIITNIVQQQPKYLTKRLEDFDLIQIEDDPNSSSFFITCPVENDLFEESFRDCVKGSTDDDSFIIENVPLIDRIKAKK